MGIEQGEAVGDGVEFRGIFCPGTNLLYLLVISGHDARWHYLVIGRHVAIERSVRGQ
jgi:hypothetical protein